MTREQYSKSVIDIMTHKNPYGQYHAKNFQDYSSLGESAPINSDIINNMPNAKIILSEEVYEMLQAVQYATAESNQEFPFFLYGKETGYNQIEFNQFISSSGSRQSAVASFDDKMTGDLTNKLRANQDNGFVVCHGHSHPPIGSLHENFSLGDFTSYMQMNQDNEVFKNKHAELTGCLVTNSGDINFVYYDSQSNNFYRFTNVYVKSNSQELEPVNCYKLHQNDQYHKDQQMHI